MRIRLEKINNDFDKYFSQFVKGLDYSLESNYFSSRDYLLLQQANKKLKILNKYIYEKHFIQLVKYIGIKNKNLEKYILHSYKTTPFEDSNFISRGDYFITPEGVKIAEINHDTPGGVHHAYLINSKLDKHLINPNELILENLINALKKYSPGEKGFLFYGSLAYREEYLFLRFMEDLLEDNNMKGYVGQLNMISYKNGKIMFQGNEIDTVFRYYPIDRIYEDFDMSCIEKLQDEGKFKVINPEVSYPQQIKLYYSYLWENIDKFNNDIKNIIAEIIPVSIRMTNLNQDEIKQIKQNKNDWVLKDTNNREGQGIYMGNDTPQSYWEILVDDKLKDDYFIIQKRFKPILDENKYFCNYGVYDIDGQMSGMYLRIHKESKTDEKSMLGSIGIDPNL